MNETNRLTQNQAAPDTIEDEFNSLLESWQTKLLHIGQHVRVMNNVKKSQVQSAINKEHIDMKYNEAAKKHFEDFSKSKTKKRWKNRVT